MVETLIQEQAQIPALDLLRLNTFPAHPALRLAKEPHIAALEMIVDGNIPLITRRFSSSDMAFRAFSVLNDSIGLFDFNMTTIMARNTSCFSP